MTDTLLACVLARLEADPGRRCIAFPGAAGEVDWWSRARFFEHGRRSAAALAGLGLGAGGVCIVVAVEPLVCATSVLAIASLGGVPLLIAPPAIQGVHSSLAQVVGDVVERTGAALAILPEDMRAAAPALAVRSPGTRLVFGYEGLVAGEAGEPPLGLRAPGDVAALQLTSGTTRFPRIAVWREGALVRALASMARAMDVGPDDVYANWTPLYHDMGLVNNLLFCLAQGVPLALLSPLDVVRRPALWLRTLDACGATTTWSPNFGYALAADRARDDELEGVRLDRVRGFWNAAERVHLETFERFQRRFGPLGVSWDALKANLGCVETIGGVTFSEARGPLVVERVEREALQAEGLARIAAPQADPAACERIVGCGRPYPGAELLVLDGEGHPCADGVVGELAFRGVAHLDAYLGEPEETAATLRDGSVRTGDLGYRRGEQLFWTGRSRERINLQGKKFDPSELERVLFAIDGLRTGSFVAFGVEDAERGTETLVVLAEVVPEAEAQAAELAQRVRRELATQLGVTVEELALVPKGTLTKTSSGKRRHRHFRELYLADRLPVSFRLCAGRLGGVRGS